MELYIIGYTFIGIMMIFLYSLPLRILGSVARGMRKVINLKNIGGKKPF